MANKFNIGYTPNDFFYIDATTNGWSTDDAVCGNLKISGNTYSYTNPIWIDTCQNDFPDNSFNCTTQQLCLNKMNQAKIRAINSTHNGADKNYVDSKLKYEMTIMDIINLGIGIVFTIIIIYKNRNIL